MVSSIEDIHRAKAALEKAKSQLAERGMDWNHDMEVGVMIEIPALALMADMVAKEVDFASIGTNDLVQYTLAVDRVNPAVSQYYRPFHPAIMRLLNYIIQEFRMAGKGISVCGEMGGDPVAATALLGMGIRTLSAGAASVPMPGVRLLPHPGVLLCRVSLRTLGSAKPLPAEQHRQFVLVCKIV